MTTYSVRASKAKSSKEIDTLQSRSKSSYSRLRDAMADPLHTIKDSTAVSIGIVIIMMTAIFSAGITAGILQTRLSNNEVQIAQLISSTAQLTRNVQDLKEIVLEERIRLNQIAENQKHLSAPAK